MARIGFPSPRLPPTAPAVPPSPRATGGRIDIRHRDRAVALQIHDPAAYLTPDVTLGRHRRVPGAAWPGRVRVSGARGRPAPDRAEGDRQLSGGNGRARPASRCRARRLCPGQAGRPHIRERLAIRGLTLRLRRHSGRSQRLRRRQRYFAARHGSLRLGDYHAHFAFGGDEATVRAACRKSAPSIAAARPAAAVCAYMSRRASSPAAA